MASSSGTPLESIIAMAEANQLRPSARAALVRANRPLSAAAPVWARSSHTSSSAHRANTTAAAAVTACPALPNRSSAAATGESSTPSCTKTCWNTGSTRATSTRKITAMSTAITAG